MPVPNSPTSAERWAATAQSRAALSTATTSANVTLQAARDGETLVDLGALIQRSGFLVAGLPRCEDPQVVETVRELQQEGSALYSVEVGSLMTIGESSYQRRPPIRSCTANAVGVPPRTAGSSTVAPVAYTIEWGDRAAREFYIVTSWL